MAEPFYAVKGWWKSKTVWTGVVAAITGVLALFGVVLPVDPATLVSTLAGVLTATGLGTILFRSQATAALTTKPAATTV